ncbi:MAG: hypothetical protein P8X52_04105, partial [Limibacillus sp.]
VRDEISVADRGNLQFLWTAVFFVMLLAVPLYSSFVSRFSRGVFIPWANRFFGLNLILFFRALELLPLEVRPWIDRVFYVWASVFALFVVTVAPSTWIVLVVALMNERRRCLHDYLAGTVVVRASRLAERASAGLAAE